jgi:hypothetical protein
MTTLTTLEERLNREWLDLPPGQVRDLLGFIRQELALDRAIRDRELREKIEKMKYGQPLLGTPESTERVMKAVNATYDEILALLAESK